MPRSTLEELLRLLRLPSDQRPNVGASSRKFPERVLSIDPLVGWRSWWVSPHPQGATLRGMTGFTWEGPTVSARCRPQAKGVGALGWFRHHDPVPALLCSCGIYATRQPSRSWGELGTGQPVAVGLVELSGRVMEHTDGFRAEHARILGPLALVLPRCSCPRSRLRPHQPCRLVRGRTFRGVCSGPGIDADRWLGAIRNEVEDRYGVEILT